MSEEKLSCNPSEPGLASSACSSTSSESSSSSSSVSLKPNSSSKVKSRKSKKSSCPSTSDVGDDEKPSIVYSREALMNLRQSKSSSDWPSFLDECYSNSRGLWDPHNWHRGITKEGGEGCTPTPNVEARNTPPNHEGKPESNNSRKDNNLEVGWRAPFDLPMRKDVKERLKDVADDGIILSPQRRSFLSGCHAPPPPPTPATAPEEHGNNNNSNNVNKHASSRRMDLDDRDEMHSKRWRGLTHHHHHNHHYNHNNHHGGSNNKRYGRHGDYPLRRHQHNNRNSETEPEWMSASISHGDVMELRGFDDDVPATEEVKKGPSKTTVSKETTTKPKKEEVFQQGSAPEKDSAASSTKPCDSLQIMDILDLSQMPDFSASLLPNTMPNGSETKKESRFSKFFQNRNLSPQPSPSSSSSQTVSVPQQQQQQLQPSPSTMPTNPQQTMIRIPSPGDSNNYFAPISPAAPTKSEQLPRRTTATSGAPPVPPNSLMEMLRVGAAAHNENHKGQDDQVKNKAPQNNSSVWNTPDASNHQSSSFSPPQSEEKSSNGDLSAFKKFAALVQGSHQDNNLPQPLRHLPQQQQQQPQPQLPPQLQGPGFGLVRPSPIPANAPTENDILLGNATRYSAPVVPPPRPRVPPQFQLVAPPGMVPPGLPQSSQQPPLPNVYEILQFIQHAPFSPEILKRSEFQALQSGLARGNITHSMLIQQLALGNLNPLRKLVVLNVLKVEQMSGKLGVAPPHPSLPPVISPMMQLPPTTRGTPPQQHHHASINSAGDALLSVLKRSNGGGEPLSSPTAEAPPSLPGHLAMNRKKMMEEQHCGPKKTEEGSPLVFTPTVVIKRMAADRRDSDPKPIETLTKQQHQQPPPPPPPPQQQPENGAFKRLFGQNNRQEEGLSRFFTPDVLAQASSGNVPSMPPLPTKKALTLEELEKLQLV